MPSIFKNQFLFKSGEFNEKTEAMPEDSDYDFDFSDCYESDDEDSCDSSDDEECAWSPFRVMPRVSSEPTLVDTEMTTTQVSVLINQLRTTQHQNENTPTKKDPVLRRISARKGNVLHIQGVSMGMTQTDSCCDLLEGSFSVTDMNMKDAEPNSSISATAPETSPFEHLKSILAQANYEFKTFKYDEVKDFFQDITEERTDAYSTDMIRAVRMSDVNALRIMLISENRRFDGCNKFGESILHTACRRGTAGVIRFLLEEAKVDVRVRDDYGRTPMHDACWTVEPNMQMIGLLVKAWPDLLLMEDKRGMTPLEYVRAGQWAPWIKLMKRNQSDLLPKMLLQPWSA
eukprot:CAMPEP_0116852750 /NCGR_PEP_ID=MMETSP0418-20121206/17492_1 /TAXON_ID=1158023 /ORGANISM="Astrosyne radiata, Strain 13vi08-1A" /LENGTH=343 /DNA_ID=CAMNT_0004484999 /DNA_START=1480 /DNA_END=2511 /DNA_ORIENTATION=+